MKMPVEPVFVAVDVGNSRLRIGSFSATASVGRLPEAEWQNALLHAQLDAPDWLDDISSQLGDSATPWFVASVHISIKIDIMISVTNNKVIHHYSETLLLIDL